MIYTGDCLDVMAAMEPESVDVTDRPEVVWRRIGSGQARHWRLTCRQCGNVFETRAAGKAPAYCSEACRRDRRREYNRDYMRRHRARQ